MDATRRQRRPAASAAPRSIRKLEEVARLKFPMERVRLISGPRLGFSFLRTRRPRADSGYGRDSAPAAASGFGCASVDSQAGRGGAVEIFYGASPIDFRPSFGFFISADETSARRFGLWTRLGASGGQRLRLRLGRFASWKRWRG